MGDDGNSIENFKIHIENYKEKLEAKKVSRNECPKKNIYLQFRNEI